jgi:anti-sigma B factor antagonist
MLQSRAKRREEPAMAANPTPTQLDITTDGTPTESIVHCTGKITLDTAELLRKTVKPLLSQGTRVALDLANVSYVDSSGLGTIVGLYASAKAANCQLKLVNLSGRLKDLLSITHLGMLMSDSTFWSSSANR